MLFAMWDAKLAARIMRKADLRSACCGGQRGIVHRTSPAFVLWLSFDASGAHGASDPEPDGSRITPMPFPDLRSEAMAEKGGI